MFLSKVDAELALVLFEREVLHRFAHQFVKNLVVLVLQVVEQPPAPQVLRRGKPGFDTVGFAHCQQRLIGVHFADAFAQQHLRLWRRAKISKSRGHRIELRQFLQHYLGSRKSRELRRYIALHVVALLAIALQAHQACALPRRDSWSAFPHMKRRGMRLSFSVLSNPKGRWRPKAGCAAPQNRICPHQDRGRWRRPCYLVVFVDFEGLFSGARGRGAGCWPAAGFSGGHPARR
jgi:hypothetical protein